MKALKKMGMMMMGACMTVSLLGGCGSPQAEAPAKEEGAAGNENTEAKKETSETSAAEAGESVKIVMDNTMQEQYEELFKSIGDELGITIELVVAPGNYEQFLQTQLQSSEKPDLYKLNGQLLTGFVKDGMIADLNSYFTGSWKEDMGEDDWNKLTKGPFDQCRRAADDVTKQSDDPSAPLWAIPFDSGCQSFGVNRGMIEGTPALSGKLEELVQSKAIPCKPWEVGTDGQVEAYTYSEFAAFLSGMQKVIAEGSLEGAAENLSYAIQGPDSLKLMAYSAGGSFLSEDKKTVTLTDEAILGAAYFIKTGINEGYIDSMMDGGEGWNNWVSGMYLISANTGTWEYGTYLENDSDIAMMPIPVPDGGDRAKWVSGQTGSCMVLRKDSPNMEPAAKVMGKFISRTSEEFQLKKAMNMPMYDDSWENYIAQNDAENGGFYPYDANCKKVFNAIISGEHGQVQETYYTVGRTWWTTLMTDFANEFCADSGIVTKENVTDWFSGKQEAVQALLDEGI